MHKAKVIFLQFAIILKLLSKVDALQNFNCTVIKMEQGQGQGQDRPNLSILKWDHAVNSQELLNKALNEKIDLIEADIVLGKLNSTGEDIPIMAHPPAKSSDLSLVSFLEQVKAFNNEHSDNMKGIKLDFKSVEVFEGALDTLKEQISQLNYPVWLNADIIKGPVNENKTKPVDAKRFLDGCKQFPKAVLSIGWTTKWSTNYTEGSYTSANTAAMLDVLRDNHIKETGQAITFPVRAGIAANSVCELYDLVKTVDATNNATLTIWSASDDYVNVEKLQHLISYIGVDKIYVDVPKTLADQLNLGN